MISDRLGELIVRNEATTIKICTDPAPLQIPLFCKYTDNIVRINNTKKERKKRTEDENFRNFVFFDDDNLNDDR